MLKLHYKQYITVILQPYTSRVYITYHIKAYVFVTHTCINFNLTFKF